MSKRLDPSGLSGAFARRRTPTALDHLVPAHPGTAAPHTAPEADPPPVAEVARREAEAAEVTEASAQPAAQPTARRKATSRRKPTTKRKTTARRKGPAKGEAPAAPPVEVEATPVEVEATPVEVEAIPVPATAPEQAAPTPPAPVTRALPARPGSWAPSAPPWRIESWWRGALRRAVERACGTLLRAA